jgi:hypothetical protein
LDPFLVSALLLSVASAALFILVGRTVQQRPVSPDARIARGSFVAWWYALGAVSLVGAVMEMPGFPLDLRLFVGVTILLLFVICVALAGLVQYLVFLYTNRTILPALAVGYGAFFLLLLLYIWASDPSSVEPTRWGPELEFANEIDSGPLYWTVLVLMLVPPLLSAGAYLSLYRVATDRILKRRILLVSLSLIIWFGSSLIGATPGTQDADWWKLSSKLIALAAAGTILYAYVGLRPDGPESAQPERRPDSESIYEAPRREAARIQRAA